MLWGHFSGSVLTLGNFSLSFSRREEGDFNGFIQPKGMRNAGSPRAAWEAFKEVNMLFYLKVSCLLTEFSSELSRPFGLHSAI